VTEYSNASATGLFDPFGLVWNKYYCNVFGIPMKILPEVLDTNGDFGSTDPDIFFGASIPIRAAAGDQSAALFGQCCFEPGSVKVSQGSGAFVDMAVGSKPKLSERGLYPFVAWSIKGKPTYLLEGHVSNVGTLIDWLGDGIGLSDTPKVLDELAEQCEDTEGVVFVPSPEGMSFPYFNARVKASIFGLSLSTHRRHVARAVIEGLALSLNDVIQGMANDTKIPITQIKVDGGVSKSDVLLRVLASFANITVYRAPEPDMTATGVAYLAGLGVGIWKDLDEIRSLAQDHVPFEPNMDPEVRKAKLAQWNKVVHTMLELY
jgi:glycerol kinase